MKAIILAAGRGERMKPLTDHLPKPLLPIGDGETLLGRHIKRLKKAGIKEIIINHAWLGHKIVSELQDGQQWGVKIIYSPEGDSALETAGGIAHALPLLGEDIFLAVNGDIYTDFVFAEIFSRAEAMRSSRAWAHLWLVNNPHHHPEGDYAVDSNGYLLAKTHHALTFSGIGLYAPQLFKTLDPNTPYKLADLVQTYLPRHCITASVTKALWFDIGTPGRLLALQRFLARNLPENQEK